MDLMHWIMLAGGLALLTAGAELLVRGASRLAALCGISPLVIGLTVVAYGTSTPELAVSIKAGLQGLDDIAVANVVGSNIFNVLFILGACAALLPLRVTAQLIRLDVPIMIAASVLFALLGLDQRLDKRDGLILFAGIVWYTVWSIRKSRRETAAVQEEYAREYGPPPTPRGRSITLLLQAGLILAGLALLVLGARWLVDSAVVLARTLGVGETVIGLTIVAAGTSLPELATSIVATVRGERDIAIGNVVGSNVYNLLCILGLSAMVTPGGLSVAQSMTNFDIPVMLAVAISCLPIFFTNHAIARWEGLLFFLFYLAYVAWLVLHATASTAFPAFSTGFLYAAAMTGIFLLVHSLWALRDNPKH